VEAELARRIRARGRITFAEFMEVALYHPQAGYYTCAAEIDTRGDFVTSPVLHPAFGALMGRFVAHAWEVMGRPVPFDVVEIGGGTGALADSLLESLRLGAPSLHEGVHYRMVEASARMRQMQNELLASRHPGKVSWPSQRAALATESVTGCILSNEVVDALPFHRVCMKAGRLQEIYVGMTGDRFAPVLGEPSTPAIARYLRDAGVQLADGTMAEVRLAARKWIRSLGRALRRGCVVTVDHGYPAAELYSPRFPRGTLMCYHQQVRSEDALERAGLQDITARVDFTALSEAGAQSGLVALPLLTQRDFLLKLGISSYLDGLRREHIPARDRLAERRALLALLDPDGLGNCKVLVQHKGLSEAEAGLIANPSPREWPVLLREAAPVPTWDEAMLSGEV
jgi:SAM-dependent MidA family methyltransferase